MNILCDITGVLRNKFNVMNTARYIYIGAVCSACYGIYSVASNGIISGNYVLVTAGLDSPRMNHGICGAKIFRIGRRQNIRYDGDFFRLVPRNFLRNRISCECCNVDSFSRISPVEQNFPVIIRWRGDIVNIGFSVVKLFLYYGTVSIGIMVVCGV